MVSANDDADMIAGTQSYDLQFILCAGGGVTSETNQRIHLAQLCYDWSHQPELNGAQTEGTFILSVICGLLLFAVEVIVYIVDL